MSFVSIPQGTVTRTYDVHAEYHEKTKHGTPESLNVDMVAQSSAYAEIASEVHCCL